MWGHAWATQMCTAGQLHTHPRQGALVYPVNPWELIQGSQGSGKESPPQNLGVQEGLSGLEGILTEASP